MDLKEFLKKTFISKDDFFVRPRIHCNSGFTMSVQGSTGHYCKPRITANAYDEVEVGFPSEANSKLMPYADKPTIPLDTVYAYVPVSVVQEVIDDNGGIDLVKTFAQKNKPLNYK